MADDKKKREVFKKMLYELAQQPVQQNDLHNYYERYEQLYGDGEHQQKFRHYYSDIFECLAIIEKSSQGTGERKETKETNMSMDVLALNLYSLLDYANNQKNEKTTTPNSLKKLYDHVNLEMARIKYYVTLIEDSKREGEVQYIASRLNELSDGVKQATKSVDNVIDQANKDVAQTRQDIEQVKQEVDQAITQAKQDVKQAKHNVEKASKKLKNVQKEYIAILSIFASVILAFTGGLSFLGKGVDIIENVDVKIENVTFVLGIGGVLFLNLLFGMFKFISAILDKKFGFKCLIGLNIIVVIALVLLIWLRGLYII